jgi:hypothetical protein
MTRRLAVLFALIVSAGCTSWTCRVDARPDDFEVRVLPGVVQTSRLAGAVLPYEGGEWLASNEPGLEIWPATGGSATTKLLLPIGGELPPIALPAGRYCFRASARGFTAAVGRIEIRRAAPVRRLDVHLPPAT